MRAVEASSRNEAVIQQAQNEVRAAQASITFLEDELRKLQLGGGGGGSPMRGEAPMNGRGPVQGVMSPSRSGVSGGPAASPSRERPLPPPPPDGQEVRKEPKNYSQLGESDRVPGIACRAADV